MLPALVLLLVYNLCCTNAISFHPEQMDKHIGHDLLLQLVKRMDAKDAEIQELREIQKLQEENINRLMAQIGAHDVDINDIRKKLNEKDNAINEMDQRQKRQDENLNELRHVVVKLQFENVQLRKSYPKCAKRIQSLQDEMKNYMQRNKNPHTNRLEKTSYNVKGEAKAIDDNVESGFNKSTSAITVSHNRRDSVGKNQEERRQAGTDIVAFFATLTSNALNLGVGQNIRFDHVITNIGSAYNPHVGAFFAPVSGTYVIMSTLMAFYGHDSHFEVVHNGNMVCRLYVVGRTAGTTWDTSSGSFVLHLEKGDVVSIRNVDSGENLNGDHYSYFSGFLLQEMENSPSVVG